MSEDRWLTDRIEGAPPKLREAMLAALADVDAALARHDRLAEAAVRCIERGLRSQALRECALDLLTADALLTHASEAAAEAGSETMTAFAAAWSAQRFESILQTTAP